VFWFEDIYRNKDLVPTPSAAMAINGKQGVLEKVDTYTVKFKFPEPYYMLPTCWRFHGSRGPGVARRVRARRLRAGPLPEAVPPQVRRPGGSREEGQGREVRQLGSMFLQQERLVAQSGAAGHHAWKTVTPINTPTWTLERNPYSVFVDPAGNQLPYIDRVVLTLAENLEVINLRAIAGEYDFQARHLDLAKVPVFIENQAKGGYKLYLDPGDYGGDMIIKFNLSYEADPEIAKWMNTTDFRRRAGARDRPRPAQRDVLAGDGTPSSVVPADNNKYNPVPE